MSVPRPAPVDAFLTASVPAPSFLDMPVGIFEATVPILTSFTKNSALVPPALITIRNLTYVVDTAVEDVVIVLELLLTQHIFQFALHAPAPVATPASSYKK